MSTCIKKVIEANNTHLLSLIEMLGGFTGTIVPIIGAGMSIPCGMPGWTGFLEELVKAGHDIGQLSEQGVSLARKLLEDGDYEGTADVLYSLIPKLFKDRLQTDFRLRSREIKGPIKTVPQLITNLAITTNYDRVFEGAWREYLKHVGQDDSAVEVLRANHPDDTMRALVHKTPMLIKLHGDVESPTDWILTKSNFQVAYETGTRQVHNFLSKLFVSHTPLFIGSSLNEPRIFNAMKPESESYAIMTCSGEPKDAKLLSKVRSSVKIIWIQKRHIEDEFKHMTVYDLIDPLLKYIADSAESIRQSRNNNYYNIELPSNENLKIFEANKNYEKGIAWIQSNWNKKRSWGYLIKLLDYCEKRRDHISGLKYCYMYAEDLRQAGFEQPSQIQHAIQYYYASFNSIGGRILNAIYEHQRNLPAIGLGDYYQLKSLVQIGELYFQEEDFAKAADHFTMVWQYQHRLQVHQKLSITVLKYLATMEVSEIVFDTDRGYNYPQKNNYQKALDYANKIIELSRRISYSDGIAWGYATKAFAYTAEDKDQWQKVSESFRLARENAKEVNMSCQIHIQLYEIAFFRRKGGDHLEKSLKKWEAIKPGTLERPRDLARYYEEGSRIYKRLGDDKVAYMYFLKAINHFYREDQMFREWANRPIVMRLRDTCKKEFGLEFEKCIDECRKM